MSIPTLVCHLRILGTGNQEGTGPCILLTTYRIPNHHYPTPNTISLLSSSTITNTNDNGSNTSSSTFPTVYPDTRIDPTLVPLESIWFNCNECSCRIANELSCKIHSTTKIVCYTSLHPYNLSGLPSLFFTMANSGMSQVEIIGPNVRIPNISTDSSTSSTSLSLLKTYVQNIQEYYQRNYPSIIVHDDNDVSTNKIIPAVPNTHTIQRITMVYNKVYDSIPTTQYRWSSKSDLTGIQIWKIDFKINDNNKKIIKSSSNPHEESNDDNRKSKRSRIDINQDDNDSCCTNETFDTNENVNDNNNNNQNNNTNIINNIPSLLSDPTLLSSFPYSIYITRIRGPTNISIGENINAPTTLSSTSSSLSDQDLPPIYDTYLYVIELPLLFLSSSSKTASSSLPPLNEFLSSLTKVFIEHLDSLYIRGFEQRVHNITCLFLHLSKFDLVNSLPYQEWCNQLSQLSFISPYLYVSPYINTSIQHIFFQSSKTNSQDDTLSTHFPSSMKQIIQLHNVDPVVFPYHRNGNHKNISTSISTNPMITSAQSVTPMENIQIFPTVQRLIHQPHQLSVSSIHNETETLLPNCPISTVPSHNVPLLTSESNSKPVENVSNQQAAVNLRKLLLQSTSSLPSPTEATNTNTTSNSNNSSSSLIGSPSHPSIYFLGTGAAAPSKRRSCSAIYIPTGITNIVPFSYNTASTATNAKETLGISNSMLLDCGEGTLQKLLLLSESDTGLSTMEPLIKTSTSSSNSHILSPLLSLSKIWISHMHADHHTGLLNILYTRAKLYTQLPLDILPHVTSVPLIEGPILLTNLLTTYHILIQFMAYFENWSTLPTQYFRYNCAVPLYNNQVRRYSFTYPNSTIPLSSSLSLLHYSITEWVNLPMIHSKHAQGCIILLTPPLNNINNPSPTYIIVYSGDSRPNNILIDRTLDIYQQYVVHYSTLLKQSNHTTLSSSLLSIQVIFIHEATFNNDRIDDAIKKRHSTVNEALLLGQELEIRLQQFYNSESLWSNTINKDSLKPIIILTHFSQRYPSVFGTIDSMQHMDAKSKKSMISNSNVGSNKNTTDERVSSSALFTVDMMRLPLYLNLSKLSLSDISARMNYLIDEIRNKDNEEDEGVQLGLASRS